MTRREWIAGLAACGAMNGATRSRLLGQCYVWTQEFSKRKISLADGAEEMCAGFVAAGYRAVELMSNFFQPATFDGTAAAIKKHSLAVPVVYHGGVLHEREGAAKTSAEILALAGRLQPLGVTAINTNAQPKPQKQQKTDEELAVQVESLDGIGKQLHARGMKLLLHHHDVEMAESAREWRYVLRHTDAALLSLCMDLHWVFRGGQDPLTLLREADRRVGSLHLRNSKAKVWTEEFGDGDIDYGPIAEYLRKSRYPGYLTVELAYEKDTAITRPLVEDLRRSLAYAQAKFKDASL